MSGMGLEGFGNGALDHRTRSLRQELLLQTWEADRKPVVFVTHDIDEAVRALKQR